MSVAPFAGAWIEISYNESHEDRFNPRSREGSDSDVPGRSPSVTISIHAPAKGATLSSKNID